MAIRYENECCGCAVPSYPCRGPSCPRLNVPHLDCDRCGVEDIDELYRFGKQDLCYGCFLKVIGGEHGVDVEDDAAIEAFIAEENVQVITVEEVDGECRM